jgi:hypothetical protein
MNGFLGMFLVGLDAINTQGVMEQQNNRNQMTFLNLADENW